MSAGPHDPSPAAGSAQQQQLQQRIAQLERFLPHDPANPRLLADLADAYLQAADWPAARRMLQQSLALDAHDAQARYRLAVLERLSGNPQAAATALADLHAEDPAAPAVLRELCLALAACGDWAAVLEHLESLDLAPLDAATADTFRLIHLRALHHLGRADEAAEIGLQWLQLRGAASLPPPSAGAVATALLDAARMDELGGLLQALPAGTLERDGELLSAAGFIALGDDRAAEAEGLFARSLALSPAMGRSALGAGLAAAVAGRLPQAQALLAQAVQAMPGHLGSRHALAWMQLVAGELPAAEQTLQQALAVDRNFGDTHGALALVSALAGRREEAAERLRVARRLDPGSANAEVARLVLETNASLRDPALVRTALQRLVGTAPFTAPHAAALVQRAQRAAGGS